MFMDALFPPNVSFNSTVTPRFADSVVITDTGFAGRNNKWAEPLNTYNVSWGVRTLDDLHQLLAFWRAANGRENGFWHFDPLDYTSNFSTGFDQRSLPVITAFDQFIDVADGITNNYQLTKQYAIDDENYGIRTICKPIPKDYQIRITKQIPGYPLLFTCPGVKMAVNGIELAEGTDFTVDYATGIVSILALHSEGNITAGYWFFTPVRFDSNRPSFVLEDYGIGSANDIVLTELRPEEAV